MVEEVDQAEERFDAFHARFAPFFFRARVQERSRRYLRALLGPVERKKVPLGCRGVEAAGCDPEQSEALSGL